MSTLEQYVTFKFMKGNRKTKKSKVNKFRRTIEQNGGILPATRDWIITINELNEIVDGQNHWQAIMNYNDKHRRNKIATVEIIIEPGARLDRAKEINNSKSGWEEVDYFDSYIELGNEDYATLRRIRNTPYGKSCGLTTVLQVCSYLEDKNVLKKFRNGEIEMIREELEATKMLKNIATCKKILGEAYGTQSVAVLAFARCLMIPNINVDHLVNRVLHPDMRARNFRYSVVEEKIVENIEIMYNRNLKDTNVEPLNISDMYKDVQSHNWQNMRSAQRLPSKRKNQIIPPILPNSSVEESALHASCVNAVISHSRQNSLRDNGVVPV